MLNNSDLKFKLAPSKMMKDFSLLHSPQVLVIGLKGVHLSTILQLKLYPSPLSFSFEIKLDKVVDLSEDLDLEDSLY